MLKTISAALLAASVIAAPAFATETPKTTAPVIKADQTQTKALKSEAGAKAVARSLLTGVLRGRPRGAAGLRTHLPQ